MGYIKNAYAYRELLKELILRDLKTKYRRSVLGYLWSVLNPLLMMIIISIVFSHMFRFDIENFPVYLLTGQLIYGFYSESTGAAMTSIFGNSALIRKVYVPKYIFPISKTCSSFVNLLFSLVALIPVLIATRATITPVILLLPIPLFYICLVSLGVGLILSVLAVYFRDIVHLYSVFLTALMYCTPIFYPITMLPDTAINMIRANPLYHIIKMFRKMVMYGELPTLTEHLTCLAFAVILFAIGVLIFKKKQDNFVMYM
jgi:ABC-2 type transport system permease protein